MAALASTTLFGCTTSEESVNESVAMERPDGLNDNTTVADSTDYSQMFADVGNTAQYDLISLMQKDPNLSTFAMMLEQAGLTNDLAQGESITVFVPVNAAFASWPPDSLNMLMLPENKAQAIRLLQAHVLPNKVYFNEFDSSQRIETGGGEYVTVEVSGNGSRASIGGATIVKPDIEASNGIIHIVDNLISPIDAP